jgi:hypothetical protein
MLELPLERWRVLPSRVGCAWSITPMPQAYGVGAGVVAGEAGAAGIPDADALVGPAGVALKGWLLLLTHVDAAHCGRQSWSHLSSCGLTLPSVVSDGLI